MNRSLNSVVLSAMLLALAGSSSVAAPDGYAIYREPAQGWSAKVPADWSSVVLGPEFVRGDPLRDPTRLLLRTCRGCTPAAALRELAADTGLRAAAAQPARAGKLLRWRRYRGRDEARPALAVDLAVARKRGDTELVALVSRPAERDALVRTALLPALDSFAPGAPERPRSVLAGATRDPAYWPTAGWRRAAAASQGVDAGRLKAMVATIRSARLPIDSVTVIRHGYVVLDATFGRFAAGRLAGPFASGRLHELQSVTKSVSSILLGMALHGKAAGGVSVKTTLVRLAAAAHYRPRHTDARKRAITLEDLLTMQAGFAWRESGYAYEPGSGNDVIAMLGSRNWTKYVVDRPMAARPGTTFVYNSGAAHLVSGAVTLLTGRPASSFARRQLFAPLGIRASRWASAPEGVSAGGFGLLLRPRDLAKLAYLYLHLGRWDGRQIVPAAWTRSSTTDQVADQAYDYGYLWWLDSADGYAYMAGLYGQLAAVVPGKDIVVVITSHFPASVDSTAVTRWLLESSILPAAG